MADPTDITQLDLQNLSPEEAAKLARARLAALYDQQTHAMLGMGGAMPELQKLGAAEYGQAGKEREGVQQTAANVLRIALGEKEAAARLKELENQGIFQRGQLANMAAQLELARAKFPLEKMTAESEAAARASATEHARVMEMRPPEKQVSQLENLKAAEDLLGDFPVLGAAVQKLRLSHEDVLRRSGFKVENGAVVPPEPLAPTPPQGGSFAVPKAPGGGVAPATIAPTARATHYSYNQTRTKRFPVDAKGNRIGPMETSATPWPK